MIDLVITDRDKQRPTAEQLRNAEDLFQFTVKERRELFGDGNRGIVEAGLCDGQKCINHAFLPHRRGCYCKLSRSDNPRRKYFKESHMQNCSLNGENKECKFGCDGYKADHTKEYDRARPEYQNKVFGRKVI